MNIRPRFTVIGGAAIGLIAATAVYGAVSTASSATPTASTISTNVAPAGLTPASAPAAGCAAGEELEHGVCVVHVERVVVRPASSGDHENEAGEHAFEVSEDDAAEDVHGEPEYANGEVENASGEDS